MDPLARLRRVTKRRDTVIARADAEWQEAVRDAVRAGFSTRKVGEAAGVTHTRVVQLTRE